MQRGRRQARNYGAAPTIDQRAGDAWVPITFECCGVDIPLFVLCGCHQKVGVALLSHSHLKSLSLDSLLAANRETDAGWIRRHGQVLKVLLFTLRPFSA